MSLQSALAAQLGFASESTVGTPVAPDLFVPVVSATITPKFDRVESEAIIAGRRVVDSDMWTLGNQTVDGSIGLELYNRGLSRLFTHMFGGKATTGSGPYTHTFTPGDLDGKALTIQQGIPSTDGIVNPYTARGCKIPSWELAWSQGAIPTLGIDIAGMGIEIGSRVVTDGVTADGDATVTSATAAFTAADVGKRVSGTGIPSGAYIVSVTDVDEVEISAAATADGDPVSITIGTALGSATLPSGLRPLHTKDLTVTVAGSTMKVKEGKLAANNGLDVERRFNGQAGIDEPLEANLREFTGSLMPEFTSLDQATRFLTGEEFAIELLFARGADQVKFTVNAAYDADAIPGLDAKGIIAQGLPFKCAGDTDAEAVTAVLINSDSSAD